jgi:hypothetical protein
VIETIDDKNVRKEYGSRTQQGKAAEKPIVVNSQEVVLSAAIEKSAAIQIEDQRSIVKMMLLTAGFHNIIHIHNGMFGLGFGALSYALHYFCSIDQQVLQLCLAEAIMSKIEETSNVFKTNVTENTWREVMNLLRDKPHVFYRPQKDKFYEALDKFTEKQLCEMMLAIDHGLGTEIVEYEKSHEMDRRTKDGKNIDQSKYALKKEEPHVAKPQSSLRKNSVYNNDANTWDNQLRSSIPKQDVPVSCCNESNMIKQLSSFILGSELQYEGKMDAEDLINAVKSYSPPQDNLVKR